MLDFEAARLEGHIPSRAATITISQNTKLVIGIVRR